MTFICCSSPLPALPLFAFAQRILGFRLLWRSSIKGGQSEVSPEGSRGRLFLLSSWGGHSCPESEVWLQLEGDSGVKCDCSRPAARSGAAWPARLDEEGLCWCCSLAGCWPCRAVLLGPCRAAKWFPWPEEGLGCLFWGWVSCCLFGLVFGLVFFFLSRLSVQTPVFKFCLYNCVLGRNFYHMISGMLGICVNDSPFTRGPIGR